MLRHLVPFTKYAFAGGITTVGELLLLAGLLSLSLPYLVAVPVAFATLTLADYALCRRFVFVRSKRGVTLGFAYFLIILLSGMLLTTALVAGFVELVYPNPVLGRLAAGIFVVLWDYYLNFRYNFRRL